MMKYKMMSTGYDVYPQIVPTKEKTVDTNN
jgi:hypothetical protein